MEGVLALQLFNLFSSVVILQTNAAVVGGKGNFGGKNVLYLLFGEAFSQPDISPELTIKNYISL